MDKKTAAGLLDELAVLLEIKGENPFKAIAYQKAARALLALPGELGEIIEKTGLRGIPGIGEGIRERILELQKTGRLGYYDEVKASIPPGLLDMVRIPGLGPKRAKAIHDTLGVASLGELEYACYENRLVGLPGFGEKSQHNILEGIAFLKRHAEQHLYPFALAEAEKLLLPITRSKIAGRASIAGSIRRRKELVKDIDVVASAEDPAPLMELFCSLPEVESVTGSGETKSSVTLKSGIAADLRVVSDAQFPYALHHFTGSKLHNTKMRGRAKRMDMKMNEYGLFKGEGERLIKCRDEAEIFKALGLAFIPPELREDMGEIEAAEAGKLPTLIEEADIKGAFHVHSRYSDGKDGVAEIAEAGRLLGWQYIGLTDHSKTASYAGGLSADDLLRQQAEIDEVNARFKGIHIYKGAEVDILPDGSLDYPDKVLAGLDFTVCSIHSKFKMTEAEATGRIVKAMRNPHCTMIGHPTGRLLLARDGYPLDMRKVIEVAAEYNVAIELNAHPVRLDIDWREMHYAKELGVKVAINPDAHNLEGLGDVRYGVGVARKGWLEKGDVLNTMTAKEVERYLKSRRNRNA